MAAISALPAERAWAGLMLAGALSRTAMLPALALLRPARTDGLGRMMGRVTPLASATALVIAVAIAVACATPAGAIVALVATLLVGLVVTAWARTQLGGQTGDVLGACCVLAECVLLTLVAAG